MSFFSRKCANPQCVPTKKTSTQLAPLNEREEKWGGGDKTLHNVLFHTSLFCGGYFTLSSSPSRTGKEKIGLRRKELLSIGEMEVFSSFPSGFLKSETKIFFSTWHFCLTFAAFPKLWNLPFFKINIFFASLPSPRDERGRRRRQHYDGGDGEYNGGRRGRGVVESLWLGVAAVRGGGRGRRPVGEAEGVLE